MSVAGPGGRGSVYRSLHLAVGPTDQEVEMTQFIFEHIGFFAALMCVGFAVACWIAARGTTIDVTVEGLDKRWRLPLLCSLLDTNDQHGWKLRG